MIPKLLIIQNPARHIAQGLRGQPEDIVTSAARAADQASSFENSHVFAEARERHGKRLGDVGNARRSAREAVDDRPARGIRYSGRRLIDLGVRSMLNHVVNYSRAGEDVSIQNVLEEQGTNRRTPVVAASFDGLARLTATAQNQAHTRPSGKEDGD